MPRLVYGARYISALSNLHTLNLSFWCKKITDISNLCNLHTLNLAGCKKITDVSRLGKLHTLDLSYCEQITDVSMLYNLQTLNFEHSLGYSRILGFKLFIGSLRLRKLDLMRWNAS